MFNQLTVVWLYKVYEKKYTIYYLISFLIIPNLQFLS